MAEQNKNNFYDNDKSKKDRELGQFRRPVKPVSKNFPNSNSLNSKDSVKLSTERPKADRINTDKTNVSRLKYERNRNLESTTIFKFDNKESAKSVRGIDLLLPTRRISLDKIKNNKNSKSAKPISNDQQSNLNNKRSVDSKTRLISSDQLKKYYQDRNNKNYSTQDIEITYRDREKYNEPIIKNLAKITILDSANKKIPFFNRIIRKGPNKRYRLKGFANKEYAKQARRSKQNYIKWANRIFWILIIITLLVVYYIVDPMEKINAIRHMLGID